jgi:hypothetical protein
LQDSATSHSALLKTSPDEAARRSGKQTIPGTRFPQ